MGSDVGSEYESGHESDASNRERRTRRRSQRVRALPSETTPMERDDLYTSGSPSLWGNSQNKTHQPKLKLFRVKRVEDGLIEKKVEPEVQYDGLQELFAGLAYGKVSLFQQKVREVRRICRVSSGDRSPNNIGQCYKQIS